MRLLVSLAMALVLGFAAGEMAAQEAAPGYRSVIDLAIPNSGEIAAIESIEDGLARRALARDL